VGVGVGLLTLLAATHTSSGTQSTVDGVSCEQTERLEYHVHAHVAIFINGQEAPVPAQIGITDSCLYWLHTHDTSGIIHIEAPADKTFTLGQFFAVWGQKLSQTSLLDNQVDADHQVRAYVNGQLFPGNPADIPLAAHAVIVLEYGTSFPAPPPFEFPQGL
jgi:hypothetical protein